jgi:hypothetical protein
MAGAEEPCRGPIAEAKTALEEWLLQLRDGKSAQVPLGSATVCTGDWKKICLVTAVAFSDGWSPPPRQSWSPAVSTWLDLRSSVVQNCVQNMHSAVLACPRICWGSFRGSENFSRSWVSLHPRQSPHSDNPGPGSAATGICPLRPLHEKVSDRLISACADSNRQAFDREDQCIKSRRRCSELGREGVSR